MPAQLVKYAVPSQVLRPEHEQGVSGMQSFWRACHWSISAADRIVIMIELLSHWRHVVRIPKVTLCTDVKSKCARYVLCLAHRSAECNGDQLDQYELAHCYTGHMWLMTVKQSVCKRRLLNCWQAGYVRCNASTCAGPGTVFKNWNERCDDRLLQRIRRIPIVQSVGLNRLNCNYAHMRWDDATS